MKKIANKNEMWLLVTTVVFSIFMILLMTFLPKVRYISVFPFVVQLCFQLAFGVVFTPNFVKHDWKKYIISWAVSVVIAGAACAFYMNRLVAMNFSRWMVVIGCYVLLFLFGWIVMAAIYTIQERNYKLNQKPEV